jgi:hypothetical protein
MPASIDLAAVTYSGTKTLALIPLDLDGYLFSGRWTSGKAVEVRTRFAADFMGWEQDNAKFERLVAALKSGDAGRETRLSRNCDHLGCGCLI